MKLEKFLGQHPGLKRTTVQQALHTLEANDRVTRTGRGKRGDPYRFYCPSGD